MQARMKARAEASSRGSPGRMRSSRLVRPSMAIHPLLGALGCALAVSPSEAKAEAACDGCIGPDGYLPPVYGAIELLTILSGVPAVAANPASLYTGFWTNWYEEDLEPALVKLAVQRGILDARNLFDLHLPGRLVGNVDPGDVDCSGRALVARTADGSCNNLANPRGGAVMTRFGRNVFPSRSPTPIRRPCSTRTLER